MDTVTTGEARLVRRHSLNGLNEQGVGEVGRRRREEPAIVGGAEGLPVIHLSYCSLKKKSNVCR